MAESTKGLVNALETANVFGNLDQIIARAKVNYYHDFLSKLDFPDIELVNDLRKAGASSTLIDRVVNGEFDATYEESLDWGRSEEGQEAFRKLISGE